MANEISLCLSDDWEVLEPENKKVKLHIPTMWELAEEAREVTVGGRRFVLLNLENYYYYILVGNIGDDFAVDAYISSDDDAYGELFDILDSYKTGDLIHLRNGVGVI